MKESQRHLLSAAYSLAAIMLTALFAMGCSIFDAPTASTTNESLDAELWAPELGDQIQPGVQVPIILDDTCWNGGTLDGGSAGGGGGRRLSIPPTFLELDENGGTVSCGRHCFVVPPGAVDAPTNFTLCLASGSGIAVDCGPSPLAFPSNAPVRLYLSYEGTQYDNDYAERNGFEALDPADLNIWWDPLNGGPLQMISSGRILNSAQKTLSVEVDHFSRYILG